MSNQKGRAISVSSALASLHRPHVIRRSQSTTVGLTPRSVRVVVLGAGGVGKTAMTVRFVTKRFIGDYDPTLETIYRHTTVVDDQLVNYEIMDTAGQEENSLMLEDKCKWGESFIFVYDVTDKYSFDELTRLKFIASYTHSKLRVNFSPCWVLVGNKSDLAEHERMVSTEEGMGLARELGCHIFREISVKESLSDASEVFEDLWREFSRLSPRSPSSSHRRKSSCKIQDKISILNSNACTCASEALKNGINGHTNGLIVSALTSSLKRQSSSPSIHFSNSRYSKDFPYNDANNNEERFDPSRNISRIPENISEEGEIPLYHSTKKRNYKNAAIKRDSSTTSSFPLISRSKSLCKALSVDNVFASSNLISDANTSFESSSSSSNSSLCESFNRSSSSGGFLKTNTLDVLRSRSDSDGASVKRSYDDKPCSNDYISLYHEHCRRNRGRRCNSMAFNRSLSINNVTTASTCEIGGV